MLSLIKKLYRDDGGQTTTEYAILTAVVSVAIVGLLVIFGKNYWLEIFNKNRDAILIELDPSKPWKTALQVLENLFRF